MILRETKEIAVECGVDDEWTQSVADTLVDVFSRYSLDEAKYGEPIGVIVEGTRFAIHYKVLS